MPDEKKSESYKGYVDKASYVEVQIMDIKDRMDKAQGQQAMSVARILLAWVIGLCIMAIGFAILASVILIGQNQGYTWSAEQIFLYVSLGCLGIAILVPIGGLFVYTFLNLPFEGMR